MLSARLHQINAEYQIIAVEDAVKAIHLIASQSFDLYIVDNWLGGARGIDVCRWIRKNDQYTPILFFSALSGTSDAPMIEIKTSPSSSKFSLPNIVSLSTF